MDWWCGGSRRGWQISWQLSDGCRRQLRSDLCLESLFGPAQSYQSVINGLKDLPVKLAAVAHTLSPYTPGIFVSKNQVQLILTQLIATEAIISIKLVCHYFGINFYLQGSWPCWMPQHLESLESTPYSGNSPPHAKLPASSVSSARSSPSSLLPSSLWNGTMPSPTRCTLTRDSVLSMPHILWLLPGPSVYSWQPCLSSGSQTTGSLLFVYLLKRMMQWARVLSFFWW